jgi:UDP-N-acetylmuramoyl-L-alanyl-D-glutamate--2,6-diaminopimelate ligase
MFHALKQLVPQSVKNIYHLAMAVVANVRYGFPAREIPIVAVTGTDGKTTTCAMIKELFQKAGKKVALASTVEFCIGDVCEVNTTKFTTLSSWKLQRFLRRAVSEKCDVAIFEVSSHSLDQNRMWGIRPEVAVLTNITREHLDYHKTMNRYREAKKKLFRISKTNVINAQLENVKEFTEDLQKVVLYNTASEEVTFQLTLPGRHNIENALAAMEATKALGVDADSAIRALEEFRGVPGRFEHVPNDCGFEIIIDYAVTPAALEKFYATLSSMRKKDAKIIAVFGACGDRDRGKRPIMGEIVDNVADVIILTNEDPYWEDPEQILDEVERGIDFSSAHSSSPSGGSPESARGRGKVFGKTYFRIFDRREAIAKALKLAKKGDVIAITGKGAEETMMVCGKMILWSDKKTIEELLRERRGNVKRVL